MDTEVTLQITTSHEDAHLVDQQGLTTTKVPDQTLSLPGSLELRNMVNRYMTTLKTVDKMSLLAKKPAVSINVLGLIASINKRSLKAIEKSVNSQSFNALIILQTEEVEHETIYKPGSMMEVPLSGQSIISALLDPELSKYPVPNLRFYQKPDKSDQWIEIDQSKLNLFKDDDYGKKIRITQTIQSGDILKISSSELDKMKDIQTSNLGQLFHLQGLTIRISYDKKTHDRGLWPDVFCILNSDISVGSMFELIKSTHPHNSALLYNMWDPSKPSTPTAIDQPPHFIFHIGPNETEARKKEKKFQDRVITCLTPPQKTDEFLGKKNPQNPAKKLVLLGFQGIPKLTYDTSLNPTDLSYYYKIIRIFPIGFESVIHGTFGIVSPTIWENFAIPLLFEATYITICSISDNTYKLTANDQKKLLNDTAGGPIYEMFVNLIIMDIPTRIEEIGFKISREFAQTHLGSVVAAKDKTALNTNNTFFILPEYSPEDIKKIYDNKNIEYYIILSIPLGKTQLELKKQIKMEDIQLFLDTSPNDWLLLFQQCPSLQTIFGSVTQYHYITVAIQKNAKRNFKDILIAQNDQPNTKDLTLQKKQRLQ